VLASAAMFLQAQCIQLVWGRRVADI
jgi:hypothetical protein